MKNILTVLMVLFVSAASFAQIELVESSKTEVVSQVSYVYLEKVGKTDYNFFYKDMNSVGHEYVNFAFKNLDNDVDKLYQILSNGFTDVPRDPLKMKANGEIVWLKYTRDTVDNTITLTIEQYVSTDPEVKTISRPLTLEDVNTLFGK